MSSGAPERPPQPTTPEHADPPPLADAVPAAPAAAPPGTPTDAGGRAQRSVPLPPRGRRPLGDRQYLTAEGLFAGTATAIHQAFFVTLLVQLGIGSLLLGVYTALNGLLANASGLIGSTIQRKVTSRRTLAALAGGLGRACFFAIAVLLWFGGDGTSTMALVAVALVSAAVIGLGLPVLTSVIADTVTRRERGQFFATRLLASGVGAATVSIVIAAILRGMSFPDGYVLAYVLAGLAGLGSMGSILALRRVQPMAPTPAVRRSLFGGGNAISPVMRRYVFSTFVLWFGAALVAPVLTPYLLEDLKASASFLGVMAAVNAIVGISVQRWWGRRVDRIGSYPVLMVTMLTVSSLPVLYALTPTFWLALAFEVVSGIGWSGYAVGNLNYAMEVAPAQERVRYTAVANAAAGLGAFVGPLTAAGLLMVVDPRVVLLVAGGVRVLAAVSLRLAKPTTPHDDAEPGGGAQAVPSVPGPPSRTPTPAATPRTDVPVAGVALAT